MWFSIKMKVTVYVCLLCASGCVYASSYSSNFSLNDETLDFAHNGGYLESSSYNMDLSGIFWTDRPSESASFTVIDANSDLVGSVPPPPPPPPPGGGGPIAGGRPDYEEGETDVALIGMLPEEEERPDLDLHGVAEEEEQQLRPSVPVVIFEPVLDDQKIADHDDFDGCSAQFELKYMNTNPYIYDTDKDTVGDCDEDWVYGTNPIVFDENFVRVGVAKSDKFVYTQKKPLFVGRADFGIEDAYLHNSVQLGIELFDPRTEIGMFFLELKKDLNFIGFSQMDLMSGLYETVLYRNGSKQENPDMINIDTELEYESLEVYMPDRGIFDNENGVVYLRGRSGSEYGVVAFWVRDEYVDVSAVVADMNGEYYIASPKQLEDGEYSVYLYSIYKNGNEFVQTNYQTLGIRMEEEIPYVYEKIEISTDRAVEQVFDDPDLLHESDERDYQINVVSYLVLLTIVITSCFFLWQRKN